MGSPRVWRAVFKEIDLIDWRVLSDACGPSIRAVSRGHGTRVLAMTSNAATFFGAGGESLPDGTKVPVRERVAPGV